jgi:hypothetical protein
MYQIVQLVMVVVQLLDYDLLINHYYYCFDLVAKQKSGFIQINQSIKQTRAEDQADV